MPARGREGEGAAIEDRGGRQGAGGPRTETDHSSTILDSPPKMGLFGDAGGNFVICVKIVDSGWGS